MTTQNSINAPFPFSPTIGGTGVNNGSSTITIGGNITVTGAYTFTANLTGNTNVTFPVSGTLATVGATVASITGTNHQVLANSTYGVAQTGAVTLTTPQDIDTTSNVTFNSLQVGSLTASNQILSTKTGSLTSITSASVLLESSLPTLGLWNTSSGNYGTLVSQDGDFTKFITAPYAGGTGWVWFQYTASSGQIDILANQAPGGINGGITSIYGGQAGNSGQGGHVQIIAGSSGTTSLAGNVYIRGGIATSGQNGNVYFDQGFVVIDSITASSLVFCGPTNGLEAAVMGTHLSLSAFGTLSTDATNANTVSTIVARDGSGNFSAGTITATLSGTATNATNVATTQVSTNATYYPLFVASSTNSNQPCDLGTGLTFNPSTNTLTTTTFSGAFSGTATNATNIGITNDTTTNATMYPVWVTANTGNLPAKVSSTKMTFNPSSGSFTLYGGSVTTAGTAGVITVNGSGSTTVAGSIASFTSGNTSTAGNIYGIAVEKFGTEVLLMGVNKNTTTGSVPSNTCFISTYQSAGQMAIGRGGSNNLPSSADILLNGDGTITLNSNGPSLTGTQFELSFVRLGQGNYINLGTSGRNIGVRFDGAHFLSYGFNWDATNTTYVYSDTSVAGSAIELYSDGIRLKYAPASTAGTAIIPTIGFHMDGSGNINIAGLTASELVATDSSKNLVSGNLSGDVSSSQFVTTLATVNSNVGTFGDGTHVAQVTVNGKGLITAVSNVTITGAAPTGAAGGDLSGNFPNPTVAKINGVTLGSTTATAGNLLIGSGTQWVSNATSGNVTINSSGVMTIGALQVTNSMIANTTIDLTAKVTGILPAANGGTANGFTAFSGPATSTKTFTLPNATCTILTTNATVTTAQGGTGNTVGYASNDAFTYSACGGL